MPERDDDPDATTRLVVRAKAGDEHAYDRLFERAADRLQLFLRVRLGAALRGHEELRDLLQETWLAAHRAFAGFEPRGEGSFVRWLCQIAENRIRARADHHAAEKRRPPGELERVSRIVDRIAAGETGVVTRADRAEQQQRLAEAMAALPHDEREAMRMRHFEGCEYAEIAARLGIGETAARRLVGRATVRLGSLLRPVGGGR